MINTDDIHQETQVDKKSNLKQGQNLNLEDIVFLANKVGLDYVEAKNKFDKLELLKASKRAEIMEKHDDNKRSEAKIRRLAETDEDYMSFLSELSEARAECERLKIRYESYKNLFEARRSMLSYQKAEMKLI